MSPFHQSFTLFHLTSRRFGDLAHDHPSHLGVPSSEKPPHLTNYLELSQQRGTPTTLTGSNSSSTHTHPTFKARATQPSTSTLSPPRHHTGPPSRVPPPSQICSQATKKPRNLSSGIKLEAFLTHGRHRFGFPDSVTPCLV